MAEYAEYVEVFSSEATMHDTKPSDDIYSHNMWIEFFGGYDISPRYHSSYIKAIVQAS